MNLSWWQLAAVAPLRFASFVIIFVFFNQVDAVLLERFPQFPFHFFNCLLWPAVQRQPVTRRTVRRWSQEAEETLWVFGGYRLECTLWATWRWHQCHDWVCVSDHINFCVDNTIPTRTGRCFTNNKPWIHQWPERAPQKEKKKSLLGERQGIIEVSPKRTKSQDKTQQGGVFRRKLENYLTNSLWDWMVACLTRWSAAQETVVLLIPPPSEHLRLPVQVLSSAETLSCEVHQWWTRNLVQTTGGSLCGVVWEQSSHLGCEQDKGDDCGFSTAFSSWLKKWRSINTLVFTWTTDWTGDATLMLFTRRGKTDFTLQEV